MRVSSAGPVSIIRTIDDQTHDRQRQIPAKTVK